MHKRLVNWSNLRYSCLPSWRKKANDSRRCEEKALNILYWLAGNADVFDFKEHFLARLKLRGGDFSRTEECLHKNLEKELQNEIVDSVKKNIPRIGCQLHLANTICRHLE